MKSNNKNFLYIPGFCLAMAFSFVLGAKYDQYKIGENLSIDFGRNNKVNRVLNLIRKNYVDSVNVDSLEHMAIGEILTHLDPHSIYLPPTEAKKQNEKLEGNFEGIGIEYYLLSDTILVTSVRPSGPSEKAGLKKGDKIIAVNGEGITGKGLLAYNLVNRLKGKKGSEVKVSILRSGNKTPQQFSIIRDHIVISSIDVSYMLDKETAYIKISKFDIKTEDDFANELLQLEEKGMKNLILDLRGNGGGYLSAATGLADQFLKDKELIVYTKGLHEPRTEYRATDYGLFENGKLAILIDEQSASASEIVAGAIQDLDRGVIIGRRSFGKGLVQEQFAFDDGSAMNLTVARYFTPSGRSIQRSYAKGNKSYYHSLYQNKEEDFYIDSVKKHHVAQHTFKTAKGRLVFDASGITPDYYIPLDTSYLTSFYKKINSQNLLLEFTYRFLAQEPLAEPYESAEQFYKEYVVKDEDFSRLLTFLKNKDIKATPEDLKKSAPRLKSEIKSLLARFHFKEEGFYRALNSTDTILSKALEVFSKN